MSKVVYSTATCDPPPIKNTTKIVCGALHWGKSSSPCLFQNGWSCSPITGKDTEKYCFGGTRVARKGKGTHSCQSLRSTSVYPRSVYSTLHPFCFSFSIHVAFYWVPQLADTRDFTSSQARTAAGKIRRTSCCSRHETLTKPGARIKTIRFTLQ